MTWSDVLRFISPVYNAWEIRKDAYDLAQKRAAAKSGDETAVPSENDVTTQEQMILGVKKYSWLIILIVIFIVVIYLWNKRRR